MSPQTENNTAQMPQDVMANSALWQMQDFLQENQQSTEEVNPTAFVERIFRGKIKKSVLLAISLGLLFSIMIILLTSPSYESQGLVRVVAREPKILTMDRDDSRLRLYDAFVSGETTYLQSQPVMRRAFSMFSDITNEQDKKKIPFSYSSFTEGFEIKNQKGLIIIKAKNKDPFTTKKAVNALLDAYSQLHLEQNGSRQTLRARELEVRESELSQKRKKLSIESLYIGEEYDLPSLSKAHLTKVTQLEEIGMRLDELSNALLEMETIGEPIAADTGDAEIKRATLLDRAMADMIFERAKLAAEMQKNLIRYRKSHPKVASLAASIPVIDKAIETRRQLIATLGKTGAISGGANTSKKQSIEELRGLRNKLAKRRKVVSNEAKVLNGKLVELRRINQENAVVSGMLAETRRVLDQVRLESRNSLPGTIDILSRASLPEKPAADKRKQFAVLGFFMGTGLALALIFILHQLENRIQYSDDLKSKLSSQSFITTLHSNIQHKDKREALYPMISKLQLSPHWKESGTTTISFTKFNPETTWDVPHLIAQIAQENGIKSLIVMCCDDDNIDENHKGFINTITSADESTFHSVETIDVIPYGTVTKTTGYSVSRAKEWLAELKSQYDLVILITGVYEKDFSNQVMPHLSDINIPMIHQGDFKRPIWRALSQLKAIYPLFLEARDDDPNVTKLKTTHHKPYKGAKKNETA